MAALWKVKHWRGLELNLVELWAQRQAVETSYAHHWPERNDTKRLSIEINGTRHSCALKIKHWKMWSQWFRLLCLHLYDNPRQVASICVCICTNSYPWLTNELVTLADYNLIIGVDMNACSQLNVDRSSSLCPSHVQQLASNALNTFINDLNLYDV